MNNFKTAEFTLDNKKIEVVIYKDNKSIWMTSKEICKLFNRDKAGISRHIKNILSTDEFQTNRVVAENATTAMDGKTYSVLYYHLDLVIKIGHRIKSNNAERLKELIEDYLSKPSINNEDIIIYDNGEVKIDVNVSIKEDTVWLSMEQTALLFETSKSAISYHVKRIIEDGELDVSTVKDSLTVQLEGDRKISRSIMFYNLDMIISIGYRVNSKKGIQFRRWASNVLKQYAINGYVINKDKITLSIDYFTKLDNDIKTIKNDIDDIKKRTFIEPIKEKMFFKGQFYDAYETISNIIQSSEKELIIIDPYFDSKALSFLKKKKKDVKCHIYLAKISQLNKEDLNAFQKQYGEIKISIRKDYHDRFIVVDRKVCYSIGSSLNQTGEKTSYMHETNNKKILQAILEDIEDGL